jgi:hypothetical protein
VWQGRTSGNWYGSWFGALDGDTGWTELTTGGISFSGAAALSHTFAEVPAGGLLFGGDAAFSNTYVEPTEGGVVFGGDAAPQWIPSTGGGTLRRLWYRLGLGV